MPSQRSRRPARRQFTEKPSTSPEFAEMLREFCGSLAAARA